MHGTNMLLMVLDTQCTINQPGCMENAVSLPHVGAKLILLVEGRSGDVGIHQWDWTQKLTHTVYMDTLLYWDGVFKL